ncbi:MAG TPA: DUF1330 domain-containing protein [Verrucomicrobiae bacterium]|nr:DUF1330 domain-containing protein [Verrucomicrobiae bacterium]
MAKKGYWVVNYRSVSNPGAVADYVKFVGPRLGDLGGRTIVAGMPAKTIEAGMEQTVVVVEFDSVERAIAACESDEYKAALKIFNNGAQRDFRIVEGF